MNFDTVAVDGLARTGIVNTRHGKLQTPTIFPVHNLGAGRGWNTPEYWKTFPEIRTGMFNAAYLFKDSKTRMRQLMSVGIHRFLGFPGVAFVDSGGWTFQKYSLAAKQEDLLAVQEKVGADIASSLDLPQVMRSSEPDHMSVSVQNALTFLRLRKDKGLLAYASVFAEEPLVLKNILRHLARKNCDFDGFALGSLMPRFTNYKVLLNLVYALRKEAKNKPIHVYGLGGPMVASLLVYLGVDSVDSAGFIRQAGNGWCLKPWFKRVPATELLDGECRCKVCSKFSPRDVMASRSLLSMHNLWITWSQLSDVRQAIREGRVDDLLEERFASTIWGSRAFRYAQKLRKFGEAR